MLDVAEALQVVKEQTSDHRAVAGVERLDKATQMAVARYEEVETGLGEAQSTVD